MRQQVPVGKVSVSSVAQLATLNGQKCKTKDFINSMPKNPK